MNKAKISIYAAVLSSLVMFPAVSMAKSGYFVSGQVGGALPMGKFTNQGVSITHKKQLKNSVVFDIGAGKEVYDNTFVELEVAYGEYKYSNSFTETSPSVHMDNFKTKIKSTNGFANLTYRFASLKLPVVPYFTLGAGVASNKIKNVVLSDSPFNTYSAKGKTKTNLAWQIGAGVLMPVTNNIDVNLSYKYRDLGQVKTASVANKGTGGVAPFDGPLLKGKLRTSNILLGVNFNF